MSRRPLLVTGTVATGALIIWALVGRSAPSGLGPLPSTYGKIQMVAYLEGHAQPATALQIRRIAVSSQIAIAQPGRMRVLAPKLVAAAPHIRLVVYENGMYSTPKDPTSFPESWYLHDRHGQRIHSAPHPGNVLMNPLSTQPFVGAGTVYHGWPDYVAQECARDQSRVTDGCYLDLLGLASIYPAHGVGGAVPIDPTTGRPFEPSTFEPAALRVASAVRAALSHGALVLANGFQSGPGYYAGARLLAGHVDGAQAQSWLGRDATTLTLTEWKQSVQMVIASARAGTAALLRYRCRCTPTDVAAQRTFALATYLLANTGRAYFDFDNNGMKPWQDWSSAYSLDLGRPTHTAATVDGYLSDGVYQRSYQRGLVLVNPRSDPVTVRLDRAFRTLQGDRIEQLTLPSHGAAILTA